MLKKQMEQYISENVRANKIELFDFEKDYVEKHQLLPKGVTAAEKTFYANVLERCDKETEELMGTEARGFLTEAVSYLKKHHNQFVYTESNIFEVIRVDAVALEFDEVFETYTALFGLKLQKKFGADIKAYLDNHLQGDGAKYSVMFSGEDGLWDVNFALDYMEGFSEAQSFEEIYMTIYRFVFNMLEAIETAQ
ncbi:branched-chain amino acid aminotransferase [Sporosarcina sp. YIM B06819]|uniref:branched-chain amino acid aminotransferase n=1 Tax=Sporosarcina sp. YIM B06819 TaxID=3081769 RepID=UPI00298C6CE1|nr:branched-chain amino acid aminotransferase [Sporosarcina sp. YIM B06819]